MRLSTPPAGPLANNITAFTVSALTLPPVRSVAAQLQSAAAAGHSSALATVATVAAALEASWSGQSNRLPKECQSPTEWFIADDTASHTRFFVIQARRGRRQRGLLQRGCSGERVGSVVGVLPAAACAGVCLTHPTPPRGPSHGCPRRAATTWITGA